MRSHLKREIEVYLKEIIIPILEAKPSGNQRQKHVLFTMFLAKLCADPQMLVEIYLNYDCDRGSLNNNIFEHLAGALSKLVTSIQATDDSSQVVWEDADAFQLSSKLLNRNDLLKLPTLTSDRFTGGYISRSFFSRVTFTDAILQYRAMECLMGILKSLVKWSNKGHTIADGTVAEMTDIAQKAADGDSPLSSTKSLPQASDDPSQFEQCKLEKQALQKGTDLFNKKPKKGVDLLVKNGSIPSSQPQDIAQFLLQSPSLNKEMIGEFLGDADERSVEIMHAFVDQLDFSGLEFVSALRHFLQTFRLPGEAQKIDRFMLKFAERFSGQNPDAFATAETAYVLAYSVIMLNTDLHNPQVKRRMTLQEFIKNNRGINEGGDLSEELLTGIYHQIRSLEIKLKDDVSPQRSDAEPSQQMQSNAEKYLKRLLSRKAHLDEVGGMAIFYSASHFEHVRPMFELCWMASLAAISELLKSQENNRIVALCLDGFRSAVHIAGFFDLELARSAFVTAISNFCFLSNIHEMRQKNLEAIRTVLDIAIDEGNYLKHSWLDVLQIVNHLVRLQLVPNFSASTNGQDRSLIAHRDTTRFSSLAMAESNSQSMLIAVDKVFAYSVRLTGPAIVEFIRALSQIAMDELADLPSTFDRVKAKSSPKMFSIQKVVEVAYYNMNRIRLEWKDIWAVLGPVFCSLGCHSNDTVSSFLVESLRQLSSKFLDREELSNFQFQKELLSPFVHIVRNNPSIAIKDMVIQCLQYMVQASANHVKSGWKTAFQCLGAAAADRDADLVTRAFEIAKALGNDYFDKISSDPENFKAFLSCLAQFAKNPLFPKTSLHAVQAFQVASNHMIDSGVINTNSEDTYWVAIFQGLMEMVLEVKDLEVRTRAMDHLFTHLHRHGQSFSESFWEHLLSQVLFPLFSAIGQPGAKDRVAGLSSYSDEATVWVSTTLVHALRKFVCLFTEFFDKVFQFLDGLLDLLSVCLCQEDPTLCRVGADCLRILLEENIDRMSEEDWQRIISIVIRLFKASSRISQAPEEAEGLTIPARENPAISKLEASSPLPLVPTSPAQQLNLCLTMISLVEDVFLQNDKVFLRLDPDHIFLILDLVERAYLETQRINSSFDLAHAIERQSVSKLEKFASTALSLELNCLVCLIKVLLKMYLSPNPEFQPYASHTQNRLIPLCKDSFEKFNALSEHPLIPGVKSIYKLWHQVVLRVGNFLCKATGTQFREIFGPISAEVIKTLKHRHLSHDVQIMVFNIMERVDSIYIHPTAPPSPSSPLETIPTPPN
ncbi:guanine nucleotide exchange protein for ADP-robosylation factor [Entomophthora muscae]|uniref:Guanine nucleotide exchange protein for ADP-robosylation factor n=1 Tax=Entomophthora muscae TaxID=34485 RepID=A0ACC2UD32_9FUNG|nr:guanine nucleotide exchange protein for ADP-robosylation factor [Entomophthora muscae]